MRRTKTFIAVLCAAMLALVAGCAAGAGSSSNSSSAGTGGSGVTMFGTIDANVTGVKNQSR
jgi:hypothetical protein